MYFLLFGPVLAWARFGLNGIIAGKCCERCHFGKTPRESSAIMEPQGNTFPQDANHIALTGSIAAWNQSVFYGALTGGLFSILQSAGMLGRFLGFGW